MMVDHLLRLIRIETPSKDTTHHPDLIETISGDLTDLGFLTRKIPGVKSGNHLYSRPKNLDAYDGFQLILGHGDTVWPIGTLDKNPAQVKGGTVTGPGSYDMKAGLTTIVFSLRLIDELDLEPSLAPLIFINFDEEIGSTDSGRIIERLSKLVDRAFVLEPAGSDGELRCERKGSGAFTITINGEAAHAGIEPEEGANAIHEMASLIDDLNQLNDLSPDVSVNVGTIEGGLQSNVVAPDCTIKVDVRAKTKRMAERLENKINSFASDRSETSILVEGGFRRPPMERSGNQKLWKKTKKLASELGFELNEESSGGASDGNTASQYAPTLDGLGPAGAGAHQDDEFVYVESIPRRATLLARILIS
jgi:glutamate carboxypeptidase